MNETESRVFQLFLSRPGSVRQSDVGPWKTVAPSQGRLFAGARFAFCELVARQVFRGFLRYASGSGIRSQG